MTDPTEQVRARPLRFNHPRLSRDNILVAAVGVIDTCGEEHLTMRGVGEVLGVQGMSLYRYFSSRQELLDGATEAVTDGLADTAASCAPPDGGWRQQLEATARTVRELSLDHPQLFVLIATRPVAAPGLRPPIRSARWAEQLLHDLEKRGFTPVAARAAYTQFANFLVGRLLPDATARADDPRAGLRVASASAGAAAAPRPGLRQLVPPVTTGEDGSTIRLPVSSSNRTCAAVDHGAYPRVGALADSAAGYLTWTSFRHDLAAFLNNLVGTPGT